MPVLFQYPQTYDESPGLPDLAEEVIGRAGRALEEGGGCGPARDALRACHWRLLRCQMERRAYVCRLVILDRS